MFQNCYWLLKYVLSANLNFFPLQNKMKIVTYLQKVFNYMKVRGIKVRAFWSVIQMAVYDNCLRDKQTILGYSREYQKSGPDTRKCNPKSYMEVIELANQIFAASWIKSNAFINSIFTVATAMGERVEPHLIEAIYDAYTNLIPITALNSIELKKFKSCQHYIYVSVSRKVLFQCQ